MNYLHWIPKRIAELRAQKGVSARDMSLSLGQNAGYINRIENKVTLPSITGLLYICDYFGITPQEFFDLESESPQESKELMRELKKLNVKQIGHIMAIIHDITDE
ncbi:MAG: helix-turn-helix transcriptional regulator [Oscillibacter sp.]|nr:helix-turn-helix transcriptional regulator [Oscillibacter sp.]